MMKVHYYSAATLALLALAVLITTCLSADSNDRTAGTGPEPEFAGLSAPPMGLPDTVEAGRDQALQDLTRGELLVGLWGDLETSAFERYEAMGLRPVALGCLKGGYGSNFWRGYNQVALQTVRTASGLALHDL